MKDVQVGIDALVGGAGGKGKGNGGGGGGGGHDEATRAALLDELKANLSRFGKELIDHLDHEEHSFATPVARKVSWFLVSCFFLLLFLGLLCGNFSPPPVSD